MRSPRLTSRLCRIAPIGVATAAGASAVFAFAPFGWWPLGVVSLAALFYLWLNAAPRAAAIYGFAYGLGLFGGGISWIYLSLHTYGGMAAPLAALCVLLLVMGLALVPAAAGYVQGRLGAAPPLLRVVLIMPGVWVLLEWVRGWLFGGMPWLSAGYAMLDTPVARLAPLGGVYLVSVATAITSGALVALVAIVTAARGRRAAGLCAVSVAALPALVWLGAWWLPLEGWSRPHGAPRSVALIQNHVPIEAKWAAAQRDGIITDYMERSADYQDADIVVWPEAAVPDYADHLSPAFWARLRDHPADFLFGVLSRRPVDGRWEYYNSIAAVTEETAVTEEVAMYHKRHLVPFGEFIPFERLLAPLVARLAIPMTGFTPWRAPQEALHAGGATFAASICYEDAFPREWRAQVAAAGVLLNVSEDMWFGDSLAPHQRLQMARYRSLESARPMVRASNNGLSAITDWRGAITARAGQFVRAVVTAEVQPRTGTTPYMRYGNMVAVVVAAVLVLSGALPGWLRRRRGGGIMPPSP